MNKDENSAYMRAWDEHSAIKWTHVPRRAQVSRYSEARNIYVDFFVFFVLRHWSVSQVFTPRMSEKYKDKRTKWPYHSKPSKCSRSLAKVVLRMSTARGIICRYLTTIHRSGGG